MANPTKIVTVFGENLDLFIPAQADRFLMHMRSYGAASRCEWGNEYLLAERIVSKAIHDATGRSLSDDYLERHPY